MEAAVSLVGIFQDSIVPHRIICAWLIVELKDEDSACIIIKVDRRDCAYIELRIIITIPTSWIPPAYYGDLPMMQPILCRRRGLVMALTWPNVVNWHIQLHEIACFVCLVFAFLGQKRRATSGKHPIKTKNPPRHQYPSETPLRFLVH